MMGAPFQTRGIGRPRWSTDESSYESWDGARLFYRTWSNPEEETRRCLVIFHGGHEHSGRYGDLVEELNLDGVKVFAWDARGHGRSPGERGYARHFHHFVKDANAFMKHIEERHGYALDDCVTLGHSVGSVVLATWLLDYAPNIRGAILGSPAFDVKLYVPFALPALRLLQRVVPGSFVRSYVRPHMLTHDAQEAEARRKDLLISPQISVRVLTSLFDTATRVVKRASCIKTPVLLLTAGSDWVVKLRAQDVFFERLSTTRKRHERYPSFYHEVFHELEREKPIAAVREFLNDVLEDGNDSRHGVATTAKPEAAEVSRDSPPSSGMLPGIGYAGAAAFLRTVGCLSHGIRLGWKHGFDSGMSLDHVYSNKAAGATPLGRLVDRVYLNSTGWRGIRERKKNVESLLETAIRESLTDHGRCHVVDIAAGPGRYLQDVLAQLKDRRITVLCRDCDPNGLEIGRKRALSEGVAGIRYEQGDAFDSDATAQLSPRPNVVVISGLYELFPDNEAVKESLKGVQRALVDGGSVIYTNQPFHPQLEFIANVLTNREGKPWRMRLRAQREMDDMVREVGFQRVDMLMDDAGIFSVSRAIKVI